MKVLLYAMISYFPFNYYLAQGVRIGGKWHFGEIYVAYQMNALTKGIYCIMLELLMKAQVTSNKPTVHAESMFCPYAVVKVLWNTLDKIANIAVISNLDN